jgi:hypothetical protein
MARMSALGPGIAQSVAGVNQAERVAARDVDRKKQEKKAGEVIRGQDQVDLDGVETLDAVRSLKGNEQEESGGDRQKKAASEGPKPQLDVQA